MRTGGYFLRVLATAALAALALNGCAPAAAGQAQKTKSTRSDDDMRAVYATPADASDGKRLTDNSCSRCHGANGISTAKGVPHLAGQRAAYLYSKLKAYQAGTRGDHSMENAVKFLSDDALVKVSAYYASLEPPVPVAAGAANAATGHC